MCPIDVTGLSDPNDILTGDGPVNSIRNILQLLRNASATENGTVAKILATSIATVLYLELELQ